MDEACPDRAISFSKVHVTNNASETIVIDTGLAGDAIPLVYVDEYLVNGSLSVVATSDFVWILDRWRDLSWGVLEAPQNFDGR